jgi:predicted transcriptional regulator of viral defense system
MNKTEKLIKYFTKKPGIHSHKELVVTGAYPNLIRKLVREGMLEEVSRGFYQLAGYTPERFELFDKEEVMAIMPRAVLCLISALDYHNIGTQRPRGYYVAIPIGTRCTRKKDYNIKPFYYSKKVYEAGLEQHGNIRVYSIAKTIADCFKFRNKIGLDIVLEALKEVVKERKCTINELIKMAEICRVKNIIMPYLEAI